ncbi:hypothetical protein F4782DRAFT_549713 [Xylaria castorea]|nr:hypothetical protein F4782DRAFT_549713 [Xylaria castorea]
MADPRPGVDSPPGSPPDLPPPFLKFPLLRASLFLAGVNMKQTVSEFREEGNYRYLRGIFNLVSVNQYPDTSSTWRIIAYSAWEIVSAVSIVSLVTIFVRMYYTRPGTSSDTGPGLGPAVEIPILAAFFTIFALITAAFTAFSMGEIIRTSRLTSFIPFTSPEPEICMVCLESDPITNLVSLQCYSDEEEAANPQRQLHYFHEGCIESWWVMNEQAGGRCPVCAQRALAYRTVDGEYRYPGPEPSPLAWAMYSFFACIQLFLGSRNPMAMRQLPYRQDNLGEHFATVLFRGIGSLCVLLLTRLFYAKVLYTCYLFLPKWLNEYPAIRLHGYLNITFSFFDMGAIKRFSHMVLSGPNVTRYRLPASGGIYETLIFNIDSRLTRQIRGLTRFYRYLTPRQIEYTEHILKWLKIYFSPDLGPAGAWLLRIAIVVLPFIFIHGFASRVSDLIYALTPPGLVGNEPQERPRVSVDCFVRRMSTLWFGLVRLCFHGVDIVPLRRRIFLLSPVFNGLLIGVIGSTRFSGTPLTAYIENALEAMGWSPGWAYVLLIVVTPPALLVLCTILYVLYLTVWLTIWEDFFWQLVALVLTHAAAKLCVPFLPGGIAFDSLQGCGALILTICFWLPLVWQKFSRVWFTLP